MNKFLTLLVFAVLAAVSVNAQVFYYSNSPQSLVSPGQTTLVPNTGGYQWGYPSLPTPTTYLSFGVGMVNGSNEGISVGFTVPWNGTGSGVIRDQTFSFENHSSTAVSVDVPSMSLFSYKYDTIGYGYEWFHQPSVLSGTFTVHELVFADYSLVSGAVTYTLHEGSSLNSPIVDYGIVIINSGYVPTSYPVASAIPEPSTYAACAGVAALALAFWHRRSSRRTKPQTFPLPA